MTDISKTSAQKYSFQFTGSGSEFFKIWIVNILLSILSLGIYSAWAKVRTKRYFYGNTLLMGTAFDYLAEPLKILKGRLIAVALLLLYSFGGVFSPIVQGILTLLFVPLLPWIIIKALSFNAYNSAYRNIRFDFNARYLTALGVFIGIPFLVAISFGLAYPYFVRARKRFVINHTAYGTSKFELTAEEWDFYAIYVRSSGMVLLFILLMAGGFYFGVSPFYTELSEAYMIVAVIVLALLLSLPVFMLIFAYLYTSVANLVINKTVLQDHRFESTLQPGKMCWLYFSNTVLIILTSGLFIPWAKVRTTAYRLSRTSVYVNGDINEFIAAETKRAEAIGEEVGDMFDLDIGL